MPYEKQLEVAMNAAVTAGNEIEKFFMKHFEERARFALDKKESRDSSSHDDRLIEDILKDLLLDDEFSDYSWYGEEYADRREVDLEWVVDPTDGTTQKALNIPYFSISIALVDKQKHETLLGVVFNPITGEMYYATKDKGAFYKNFKMNETRKISVYDRTDFKHMIAFTNPNMDFLESIEVSGKIWLALNKHFRIVPVLFSTALDLTRIADGLAGVVADPSTAPYDHAAGALIVEEAGGIVVSPDGKKFDPLKRGIVAVNRKETLEELKRAKIFDYLAELKL